MARSRPVEQLALDERQLVDPTLEGLLEERQRLADDLAPVRKAHKAADRAAKAAIELLKLEPEAPVRVGRFRVEVKATAGRSVAFDTQPGQRVSIKVAESPDDDRLPAPAGADLAAAAAHLN